jgi:hypothetical protein
MPLPEGGALNGASGHDAKQAVEKPLFVPLMAVHFDAFEAGTKRHEYRPHGPRWSGKTCRPGRKAVLSRGYGEAPRMERTVVGTAIVEPTPDFLMIYGECRECFAIELA